MDDEEAVCQYADIGGCSGPVTWGPDPFAYEINGNDTEIWECEEHRYQSAMDI